MLSWTNNNLNFDTKPDNLECWNEKSLYTKIITSSMSLIFFMCVQNKNRKIRFFVVLSYANPLYKYNFSILKLLFARPRKKFLLKVIAGSVLVSWLNVFFSVMLKEGLFKNRFITHAKYAYLNVFYTAGLIISESILFKCDGEMQWLNFI